MITDASGALILVMEIVGPLVLLAALIYGTMTYRRRSAAAKAAGDAATRRLYHQQDDVEPSASRPRPQPDSSFAGDPARRTEDEIARRNLGGTRGAPELGEAPLVPQQAENTPRKVEPGHTA
jgi:hypothetical protein